MGQERQATGKENNRTEQQQGERHTSRLAKESGKARTVEVLREEWLIQLSGLTELTELTEFSPREPRTARKICTLVQRPRRDFKSVSEW